jgi:hypothetical protein
MSSAGRPKTPEKFLSDLRPLMRKDNLLMPVDLCSSLSVCFEKSGEQVLLAKGSADEILGGRTIFEASLVSIEFLRGSATPSYSYFSSISALPSRASFDASFNANALCLRRKDLNRYFPEIVRKLGAPIFLIHSGRIIASYEYSEKINTLIFEFDTDDENECAPRFGIKQELFNRQGK